MLVRFLVLGKLLFVIGNAAAASSVADVQIRFEDGANGNVWGRYVFRNLDQVRADWINLADGQKSFTVSGLPAGHEAHLKTVVYVPDCAIQTYDTSLPQPGHYSVPVHCQPVQQVSVIGQLPPKSFRYDHQVRVEAKFIAPWISKFLKTNDTLGIQVPIASAALLSPENQFRMLLPDFRTQPNRGNGPMNDGAIRFLVRDQVESTIVDGLRVVSPVSQTQHFADLPSSLLRPEGIRVMFQSANQVCGHDRFGFTVRMLPDNVCDTP